MHMHVWLLRLQSMGFYRLARVAWWDSQSLYREDIVKIGIAKVRIVATSIVNMEFVRGGLNTAI